MAAKEQIIELFHQNVRGQQADVAGCNQRHDGREGQWLEHQFGVASNADNRADLWGFELKNETSSKTTFGDWSANEYIFNKSEFSSIFSGRTSIARRDKFLEIFGKPNAEKENRLSWSGEPCPKINTFNTFGQRLLVVDNDDIIAEYSYSQDRRANKSQIVPELLKQEHLEVAHWYGNTIPEGKRKNKKEKCLKSKFEDKFSNNGWFTCKKEADGCYCKICFGAPMNFETWIEHIKLGLVFFDSGMYQGNKRPYSQWRANNSYWNDLIIETFE